MEQRRHITRPRRDQPEADQGIRTKPATEVIAPIAPRNLDPTQTVMPTILGPGMN